MRVSVVLEHRFIRTPSFPLAYQSPLARLSVQLNKVLSWNFGWQFYNYSEEFIAQQNYHAHVGYSSFRWTF